MRCLVLFTLLISIGVRASESLRIIASDCDSLPRLNASRLPFWSDGRYGFLDRTGAIVIPARYEAVQLFAEGVTLVGGGDDELVHAINEAGSVQFTLPRGAFFMPHEDAGTYGFAEGLLAVWLSDNDEKNAKCGYVDHAGKVVIAPQYEICMRFRGGVAVVGGTDTDRSTLIDKNGKQLGTFAHISMCTDADRIAVKSLDASQHGKWGFIDTLGNQVIPFKFDEVSPFSEGVAVFLEGNKAGYIDVRGKVVIPNQFDAAGVFSDHRAIVVRDGKFGFIDPAGKLVIAMDYEDARSFSEGLAAIKRNGTWGYVDTSGNEVIAPRYAAADEFHERRAAVMKSFYRAETRVDRWAAISPDGIEITPFTFEYIGRFDGGIAPVIVQERSGYLSAGGTVVWKAPIGAPY